MQVRIDDDVIPLLEASKTAHGGSLSKAANRLLRASARSQPRVTVSTGSTGRAEVTAALMRGAGVNAIAEKPKRVGRCSHPILRRVGNACVVCGATIG